MSIALAELDVVQALERVVVTIRGEIDLSNAVELQAEIEQAATDADTVVLDLGAVEYIDSQGVRLLHRLSSALTARGATLVVVAPEESIAGDVLRITQMADLIEIRSSIDSA